MASVTFKLERNDVSPALAKAAMAAKHPEKVFRAMGTVFMSITMGNFNSVGAEFRPKPWAAKKDGTPSNLQKSGTLSRSFHLAVSDTAATVSNPTIYAAPHQFGFEDRNLPARPFFPVIDGKLTPAAEELIRKAGERAIQRQL